jgi:hypothetical protein
MIRESSEKQSLPLSAFRLRSLVLALGEVERPPWWPTEFMSETGFRFLERLYPRSYFHAAVHAAGKAACTVHDGAVGRVGVYHLFRLPEWLEIEIHTISRSMDDDFPARFRPILGQKDKLMEMLGILCHNENAKDIPPGPKRIGSHSDLKTFRALHKTAAVYLRAFSQGKAGYPYFEGEQGGIKE